MDEEMEVIDIPDEDEDDEDKLLAGDNESSDGIEQVDLDSSSDSLQAVEGSKNNESNDNDSEDDEEAEARAALNIKTIKDLLQKNPYHYEAHKDLIVQLQKMGELEQLRAAREDMNSKYPLTPEIWLSWIKDEMRMAATPEQKAAVMELCERAVQDYLSVELWIEYLQFCTGLGTENNIIASTREVFERALTAAGLHVSNGQLIWDIYREFESFLASMMESSDLAQKLDQINRIGKLFRRQLSCPLLNMESTFEEYQIWRQSEGFECTEDPKVIENLYKGALKQLQDRLIFENKLLSLDNKKIEELDVFKTYLNFEKKHGDPGRVTVLFERAITEFSLEPLIWLDYLEYLQSTIKMNDLTQKTFERALKNIPWCVKVWQNYLRFGEKSKKSLSDMQVIVERALEVGFSSCEDYKSLWITYLEFLRRHYDDLRDADSKDTDKTLKLLQNAFSKAWDHLAAFGIEGDPSCDLLQFWARTEALHAKDMEKARLLWADIMAMGHSESAASWLELIALEKCYGDSKHIRKTFQRALNATKDWPESIANAWINFERDEGTLEQMEYCEEKVKSRLEKIIEERQKAHYVNYEEEFSGRQKSSKRKHEGSDQGKWKNLGPSTSKSAKFEEKRTITFVKPQEKAGVKKDSKVAPPPGYTEASKPKVAPPPGFEEEKLEEEDYKFQEVDEKITVFVSNLDYTATEAEIREALKPAGEISLFRMVKDYKGRSKGFCYVQLSSPEEVEKALELDRTRINGRPMYVSRCDPSRTNKPGFKYKTGLEKNKLFIKGLPPSLTKEDLENLFKVHGALKEVRLVTFRNGHSKGIAYVDFENEADASKALLATDGMTIQDKVISVAISQPPERKKPAGEKSDGSDLIKSLGGSSTSRTTFGKPKSVLSMIPRTVKTATTSNPDSSTSNNGVQKPMNNADFRNMLLSKKS